MNYFDLFREAVLDHIEVVRGDRALDGALVERLVYEHHQLSESFKSGQEIPYDTPERRWAYMMYYAPKHAFVWKRYVGQQWRSKGTIRVSSFGTGPGSELVGIADALASDGATDMTCHCLEREPAWQELAELVFRRYEAIRGFAINETWVSDVASFVPGQHVVGSFVLSELARQELLAPFKGEMSKRVKPARGTFIDGVLVQVGSVKHLLSQLAGQNTYDNFKVKGWDCKEIINEAWKTCERQVCGHELPDEPDINVFKFRFE